MTHRRSPSGRASQAGKARRRDAVRKIRDRILDEAYRDLMGAEVFSAGEYYLPTFGFVGDGEILSDSRGRGSFQAVRG